jgi:hypothetical protein
MGPGVFDLLLPPEFREQRSIGPRRRVMAADGGVKIEQRAVGVEHIWHRMAPISNFHHPATIRRFILL